MIDTLLAALTWEGTRRLSDCGMANTARCHASPPRPVDGIPINPRSPASITAEKALVLNPFHPRALPVNDSRFRHCNQTVTCGPPAVASPQSWLAIQNLDLASDLPNQNLPFYKLLGDPHAQRVLRNTGLGFLLC